IVTITTLVSGNLSFIALVAASPSISGILTSIRTRSGRSLRQTSSAMRPFSASPTTTRSGSPSRTARMPSLTRSWSSARTSLAGFSLPPDPPARISPSIRLILHARYALRLGQWNLGHHLGSLSGLAMDLEAAPDQSDPFPHAGEAHPLAWAISRRHLTGMEPRTPVPDPETNGSIQTLERNLYLGGRRMFLNVGEGFLRDPGERRLGGAGQALITQGLLVT